MGYCNAGTMDKWVKKPKRSDFKGSPFLRFMVPAFQGARILDSGVK
jgi:hypothetical protein